MLASILIVFLVSLTIGIPIAIALILTVVVACLLNPALPIDGLFIFKNCLNPTKVNSPFNVLCHI